MDVFRMVRSALPEGVRRRLKQTVIDDVYRSKPMKLIRGRHASLRTVTYRTGEQEVQLDIPADSVDDAKDAQQYEPFLVTELSNKLNSKSILYNIGGGYGFYACLGERLGVPPEQIHVFEGDPFRLPILKRNAPDGTFLNKKYVGHSPSDEYITLDKYSTSLTDPTTLLVDVEGAEFAVLKGASDLLARAHPSVYVEVHPESMDAATPADIIAMGESHGYNVSVANHREAESGWQPADTDSLPLDYSTPHPTCLVRFQ